MRPRTGQQACGRAKSLINRSTVFSWLTANRRDANLSAVDEHNERRENEIFELLRRFVVAVESIAKSQAVIADDLKPAPPPKIVALRVLFGTPVPKNSETR
jgi:hypothetical protein